MESARHGWIDRRRLRARLREVCGVLAPVAAFAIPLSTSVGEVAFATLVGVWFLAGVREIGLSSLVRSPVGVASLALFGWLGLSILWSVEPASAAARVLVKYRALVYIPILLTLFENERTRRLATAAFVAAMMLTLGASYLVWFGWLEPSKWGGVENGAVFKNHIAQNVMMAFAAFLLARSAVAHTPLRWTKVTLIALAAFNILGMVHGRTGYVVFGVLAAYLAGAHLGRWGIAKGAALATAVGAVAFAVVPAFHARIQLAFDEAGDYFAGNPVSTTSSIGLRLQFYTTSLSISGERPLFGHGVGSFRSLYAEATSELGVVFTDNPHNEYLMILVQSGIVGLLLMIGLFAALWRTAGRLPRQRAILARGLVCAMAAGCLFNSMLLDTTEASFFALFASIGLGGGVVSPSDESADVDDESAPELRMAA